MAGYALAEGDLAMAAGVLVCFNGILRPIEAMLTAKQCSFDFQRGIVHLDLGYTKGGKRSGIAEHVVGDELDAESVGETLGPGLPHCFASKGMAMLQRQGLSRKDKQLIK